MAYGVLAAQTGRMVPHVPTRSVCGCAPHAVCSQCGLRRSWVEVVKGMQHTNSTTLPSQPKEEIKALEAALAALPDNVDIFGKVRATLEGRLQHARKEARDSKPLDQRLEAAEEPSSEHPRQDKQRLHSNKQRKLLLKKPKRTKHVFERNWPDSRSKHFRKPPTQFAYRRYRAKRHHSVQR